VSGVLPGHLVTGAVEDLTSSSPVWCELQVNSKKGGGRRCSWPRRLPATPGRTPPSSRPS